MYRIVVVDDDPDVLENLCEALEDLGDVLPARNSDEFYQYMRELEVDLIVLDNQIRGEEACRRYSIRRAGVEILKDLKHSIKTGAEVIFITGHAISDADREWVEQEAVLLTKPADIDDLVELAQELLQVRQNRRELEQSLVRRTAKVWFTDHEGFLVVDTEYCLAVQVVPDERVQQFQGVSRPLVIPAMELDVLAVVYAQDMDVLPEEGIVLSVDVNGRSNIAHFALVPRESPLVRRSIEVHFFYRGKGLQVIRFHVEVHRATAASTGNPSSDDPQAPLVIPPSTSSDLTITLFHDSQGIRGDVLIQGLYYPRELRQMKTLDWQHINAHLQDRLLKAVEVFSENKALTEHEFAHGVAPLLKAGLHAYSRIFHRQKTQKEISDMLQRVSLARLPTIQVVSEDPMLPWDLVAYPTNQPKNESGTPSLDNLWGMSCLVQQYCPVPGQQVADRTISDNSDATVVGILWNDCYTSVEQHEIAFLDELRGAGVARRPVHKRACPENELVAYLSEPMHILQLACHSQGMESVPDSYMELSDGTRVTLGWLQLGSFDLVGNPIVILNSCGSVSFDACHTSSFLHAFAERGASGILGTKCAIRAEFASRFVVTFYQWLLSGYSIGYCLWKARRQCWDQCRSPLGLVYSYYGDLGAHLLKQVISNPEQYGCRDLGRHRV